jgi:hypothetical protein
MSFGRTILMIGIGAGIVLRFTEIGRLGQMFDTTRRTAPYNLRCAVGTLGPNNNINRGRGHMEGSRSSVASSLRGRSFPRQAIRRRVCQSLGQRRQPGSRRLRWVSSRVCDRARFGRCRLDPASRRRSSSPWSKRTGRSAIVAAHGEGGLPSLGNPPSLQRSLRPPTVWGHSFHAVR